MAQPLSGMRFLGLILSYFSLATQDYFPMDKEPLPLMAQPAQGDSW